MQQPQWKWDRQRFTKGMKQVGWVFSILAGLFLGMDFVLTPKPFGKATIDDFAIARDTIVDATIIEKTNVAPIYPAGFSVNKFYELNINTSSGRMFHLRRPDGAGQLTRYLAVLPIGKEVSIRYFNDFSGHRILDVRDGNHIFIPFSEIIANENQTRNFGLIWTGIFALLGVVGFGFGRTKRIHHPVTKHTQSL